tara:strand:+ start:571 stop:885 length:315 start_codon:yes stop_codon:yes gene_type:complete
MSTQKFDHKNFKKEVMDCDRPVLVDVYADWCGPCRLLAPTIDEIAELTKDEKKVGKLNADENPELTKQFRINSVPTLLLFENGKEKARLTGNQSKKRILEFLES